MFDSFTFLGEIWHFSHLSYLIRNIREVCCKIHFVFKLFLLVFILKITFSFTFRFGTSIDSDWSPHCSAAGCVFISKWETNLERFEDKLFRRRNHPVLTERFYKITFCVKTHIFEHHGKIIRCISRPFRLRVNTQPSVSDMSYPRGGKGFWTLICFLLRRRRQRYRAEIKDCA